MKKQLISTILAVIMATSSATALAANAVSNEAASTSVTLSAAKAPTKLKLSVSSKTVYVDQKYTISVNSVTPSSASKSVTWKSSNSKVASVSSKGVVTGKKSGTATITAVSKINSKVKATCKVTVKNYGKKSIAYESSSFSIEVPEESEENSYSSLTDSAMIIRTYKERNKLIHYIRANYPDEAISKVVKYLKKYDEEFFETNSLIYTRSVTVGKSAKYVTTAPRSCLKKFAANGKLTVYVKTKYTEKVPADEMTDDAEHTRFNCYFTTVSKTSVKNAMAVKMYEIKK